ncbi:hypothetical protein DL96DRAFT_1615835 [Flagelloscypha sp. PMI_526]|nr:hypothetical protein DL96DRAFT_1615835 [Flagelloscypha sp. PMI_526]
MSSDDSIQNAVILATASTLDKQPSPCDLVNESDKLNFIVTFLTFLLMHLGNEEGEDLSLEESVTPASRDAVGWDTEEYKKRVATTAVLTYIVEIVAGVPDESELLPEMAKPHRDTFVSIQDDLAELTEGWRNADEAEDDEETEAILENVLVVWVRVWDTLEENGAIPWLHALLAKEGYGKMD